MQAAGKSTSRLKGRGAFKPKFKHFFSQKKQKMVDNILMKRFIDWICSVVFVFKKSQTAKAQGEIENKEL